MLWSLIKILAFVAAVMGLTWGAIALMDLPGAAVITLPGLELTLSPLKLVIALVLFTALVWLVTRAIGLLYAFLPLMVLPLYASLEKLDFRMVEAGFDLYATRGRVLRRIIVPLSKPGIVAGCILVFIPAIGAYVTPTLMGGGKQLMIGNLIALQFQGARNWPFGAALALILMLVVMIALLFYTRNATRQQAAIHG
jgi:ABC-type spermidine/putrescine transport system permease subunit I